MNVCVCACRQAAVKHRLKKKWETIEIRGVETVYVEEVDRRRRRRRRRRTRRRSNGDVFSCKRERRSLKEKETFEMKL